MTLSEGEKRALILVVILICLLGAGVLFSFYSLTTVLDLIPYFLLAGIAATLSIGFRKQIQNLFSEKKDDDIMVTIAGEPRKQPATREFPIAVIGIIAGSILVIVLLWNPVANWTYDLAAPIVIEGDTTTFDYNGDENEIVIDLRIDASNVTEIEMFQGTYKSYQITSPKFRLPYYHDPVLIKNPSNDSSRYGEQNFAHYQRGFRNAINLIGLNVTNGHLNGTIPNALEVSWFVFDREPTTGQYPISLTFSYLESALDANVTLSIDRQYDFDLQNVSATYKIKIDNNEKAFVMLRKVWDYEFQLESTIKDSLRVFIDGVEQDDARHTILDILTFADVKPLSTSVIEIRFDYPLR
jgi:hypothetical protein